MVDAQGHAWPAYNAPVAYVDHGNQQHAPPPEPLSVPPPAYVSPYLNCSVPDTAAAGHGAPAPPRNFFHGEFMPVSEVRYDNPGVLVGTNADYYNPSIPSEALGMTELPPFIPTELPQYAAHTSRIKDLWHNVTHMGRRKSERQMTVGGQADACLQKPPQGAHEAPLQDTSTVAAEHGAVGWALRTDAAAIPVAQTAEATLSQSLPIAREESPSTLAGRLDRSKFPLPPHSPAPGTVNPMDVMQPSTETEMMHRTECQLAMASYLPAGHALPSVERIPQHAPEYSRVPRIFTLAELLSPDTLTASRGARAAPMSGIQAEVRHEVEAESVADTMVVEPPSPPTWASRAARQQHSSCESAPSPSSASQQPTPTNSTAHNSPATSLETSTPGSTRYSEVQGNLSPPSDSLTTSHRYCCGDCGQFFDRHHKLNHHRRYHEKPHPCTYPNCGRGFGTKTHLRRHWNDRHNKVKWYYCSVQDCEYSKLRGKAFPRKENWKRHLTKFHHMDVENLPDPIEVDEFCS